jgi:hypothetical protein
LPCFSKWLEASINNTSSLTSLHFLMTKIHVGIPVPKKIFAGKPITASI